MGLSFKMRAEISCIASTGKASGAGLPAEKGIISGSEEFLRISRMMEGFREETRFANWYSILCSTSFMVKFKMVPQGAKPVFILPQTIAGINCGEGKKENSVRGSKGGENRLPFPRYPHHFPVRWDTGCEKGQSFAKGAAKRRLSFTKQYNEL